MVKAILRAILSLPVVVVLFAAFPCHAEGALAVGREQGRTWYSVVFNLNTLQEARNAAMQRCLSSGPNCSVVVTFRRKCLAIAHGRSAPNRGGYGWVTRDSQADAENAVMNNCLSGGRRCELKGSYCDSVDEADVRAQREAFARQEAERREAERREAERKEWDRRESERRAAERRDADLKEAQRREAERRDWEKREAERTARQKRERENKEAETPPRPTPATYGATTVLGFAAIALLILAGVLVKRDLPVGAKIFIAISGPVIAGVIHYLIGIKDEITIGEVTLLTFPFLGALVIALLWKLQA